MAILALAWDICLVYKENWKYSGRIDNRVLILPKFDSFLYILSNKFRGKTE
jgi:hypothetical protein